MQEWHHRVPSRFHTLLRSLPLGLDGVPLVCVFVVVEVVDLLELLPPCSLVAPVNAADFDFVARHLAHIAALLVVCVKENCRTKTRVSWVSESPPVKTTARTGAGTAEKPPAAAQYSAAWQR